MNTDQIEKQIFLKASRARVWKALTDSREFGSWFGMKLDGPFVAGQSIKGTITPTTADPEVAKLQEPHAGKPVDFYVKSIEPETMFVIQWHPFAIDPQVDYSSEPMTTITFRLREQDGGVLLAVTETGFDQIPPSRRAAAFKANDGGWAHQMKLIEKYLALEK